MNGARDNASLDRTGAGASPAGLRVLVVEDESVISLMIEEMLEELGCEVVGVAAGVREGMELLDRVRPDAAVLDVKHDTRPLARGWAAVATIVTFGVAVPTSVVQLAPTRDVLTSLMRESSWQSRAYAVLGLAQRRDSVDVAENAALADPNPRVREWARYALARGTSRDLSELLRTH